MLKNKVYDLCLKIPKGRVTTYKEIALALNTKAYQAIGQVLRCNPYAPRVPCHRVIASNGSLSGFKGQTLGKEIEEKVSLLGSEGVRVINGKINLERFGFSFAKDI